MSIVNNKSMIMHLFSQMEKLDKGEVTVIEAAQQANLAKQVNNCLKYELDRAQLKMELTKHNAIYKDGLMLREAELKNFNS